MNTAYYMVDINCKKYIDFISIEVKKNSESFLQLMHDSFEKAPYCEEVKNLDNFLQNQISAYIGKLAEGGCVPSIERESLSIGTSTPQMFYWRRDNGFQSLDDVKEFLKKNPACQIFDADLNEISLKQFEDIIQIKE